MFELSDLHSGQTAEWDDAGLGGRVRGTVEYVSMSTGWVTVRLNGTRGLRLGPDGSRTTSAGRVTHATVRAASLTPCD